MEHTSQINEISGALTRLERYIPHIVVCVIDIQTICKAKNSLPKPYQLTNSL